MDPCLVVSPHLDDAVLSCGQFLAGWPDAVVVTVLAGAPRPPQVTSFDVRCGFTDSADAVGARWQEDDRALASLSARPMRATLLDQQYRAGAPLDRDEVARCITQAHRVLQPRLVLAPLGLAHPDHMDVAAATLAAMADLPGTPLYLYEELPARVERPQLVEPALEAARSAGWVLTPGFPGTGPQKAKEVALAAYESQLWALDLHCCLVPERYWVATR